MQMEDDDSQSHESQTTESDSEVDAALEDHVHIRGQFYGCYLLVSKNPKYAGRTYIGFTVNPNRRIQQHNRGHQKGGARRTSGKGPWDMILIIHGFPNNIAALRFEWAWQHPKKSRRVDSAVAKKLSKETVLDHRLRVVSHMLSVPPWCRLPLTVRWLKQEYEQPALNQPPIHMPIAYGLVDIQSSSTEQHKDATRHPLVNDSQTAYTGCQLCKQMVDSVLFHCYHQHCSFTAHCTCLAPLLCDSSHVIPINGPCPHCKKDLLWGELVRRYNSSSTKRPQEDHEQLSQASKPVSKRQNRCARKTAPHWTEALHVDND